VLLRLADTASFAIHRAAQAMVKEHSGQRSQTDRKEQQKKVSRQNDLDVPALFEAEYDVPLSTPRRILLFVVALTLILVVAWLIRTWPRANHQPSSHTAALANSNSNQPTGATALPVGIDGLRQLAEQGDAAGQFALGVHYATGEDVPQDYSEAVRWFSMAAEQGHIMAQATLGAYYWAGRGVPQDMEKAYFWALLAETGGDDASKVRVAFLSSHMKRTQILAAQQRVSDWIREHQLMTGKPG
jgi:TPR repeat protein